MAKVFTGRDGRLLIGGTEQLKVTTWSLTGTLEVLPTTTLGDYQQSYTPGVQSFSGSATLLYYKDDAGRNDAATALRKILRVDGIEDSDTVEFSLRFVDGSSNHDVAFSAYVTSVTFGAGVGEVGTAQISFEVTGPLTSVTL